MIWAIDQLKSRTYVNLGFSLIQKLHLCLCCASSKKVQFQIGKFKCNDFEEEHLRISKYFEFHGHVCCKNQCSENKQPDYVDITWFVGKNE